VIENEREYWGRSEATITTIGFLSPRSPDALRQKGPSIWSPLPTLGFEARLSQLLTVTAPLCNALNDRLRDDLGVRG
jgi:hypothetical protein